MSKIIVHDMTLRDGMHPQRHQTTVEQMIAISTALDDAGVPLIEVTHGDGPGGSSVNYGFAAATDEEYLSAVVPRMKNAKISALLLPGIGTVDHLKWHMKLVYLPFVWRLTVLKPTVLNSTLQLHVS